MEATNEVLIIGIVPTILYSSKRYRGNEIIEIYFFENRYLHFQANKG